MDPKTLPSIASLQSTLCNMKEPIAKRMRSLFYLKEHGTDAAVEAIVTGKFSRRTVLF